MTTTDARSTIRRKLGRGLGSLISTPVRVDVPQPTHASHAAHVQTPTKTISPAPSATSSAPTPPPSAPAAVIGDGLHSLAIASIIPNPRQPRQHFDEASLQALANSIRISGVMQPVVVRRAGATGSAAAQFELIAGERRWRAAQIAGLTSIPAVVRDVDDRTAAEFSLVENLQREDLNPLERAEAFNRLMREFHLTHAEIAERVGLDRSSVSNHLRLLELDDASKRGLRGGGLTMGHAKALLAVANSQRRAALAAEALRNDWSVRELERRAREAASQATAGADIEAKPAAPLNPLTRHLSDLQKRLGEHLGTKVHIHAGRTKGSGKLVIGFYSIDQFEGLLRRMDFEMDE